MRDINLIILNLHRLNARLQKIIHKKVTISKK